MKINFCLRIILFEPRKKILIFNQVLLLDIQISSNQMDSNQKQTYCVEGRLYSDTNQQIESEKVNPKTNIVIKGRNGKCDICGRNKSQICTT